MRRQFFPVILAILALTSCLNSNPKIPDEPLEYSGDVIAFLIAVQDQDPSGIERRIDRNQLEAQISKALAKNIIGSNGPINGAGQTSPTTGVDHGNAPSVTPESRFLEPENLTKLVARTGLVPQRDPTNGYFKILDLASQSDQRVCAIDLQTNKCLLYFALYNSGWKLNEIESSYVQASQPAAH
jgi:hypothetical protein